MNVITCRWKDSSAFLPCKAKQVDSSPVCHYEVENLDITLIPGSVFKTLFPWEACKEILYFFDDYIYQIRQVATSEARKYVSYRTIDNKGQTYTERMSSSSLPSVVVGYFVFVRFIQTGPDISH